MLKRFLMSDRMLACESSEGCPPGNTFVNRLAMHGRQALRFTVSRVISQAKTYHDLKNIREGDVIELVSLVRPTPHESIKTLTSICLVFHISESCLVLGRVASLETAFWMRDNWLIASAKYKAQLDQILEESHDHELLLCM